MREGRKDGNSQECKVIIFFLAATFVISEVFAAFILRVIVIIRFVLRFTLLLRTSCGYEIQTTITHSVL